MSIKNHIRWLGNDYLCAYNNDTIRFLENLTDYLFLKSRAGKNLAFMILVV